MDVDVLLIPPPTTLTLTLTYAYTNTDCHTVLAQREEIKAEVKAKETLGESEPITSLREEYKGNPEWLPKIEALCKAYPMLVGTYDKTQCFTPSNPDPYHAGDPYVSTC